MTLKTFTTKQYLSQFSYEYEQYSSKYLEAVVEDFNLVDRQNRGLNLYYHIFSGVTDTVIYNLEITILVTQEKVSLPCYILQEDDPKYQILRTLQLLDTFC